MCSRVLQFLALAGLLVQAAFGAISPAAVLCIGGHLDLCHEEVVQEYSAKHTCCQTHDDFSEHGRPGVGLSVPCEDDCLHCVDVALPDEVTWTDGRQDVLPDLQVLVSSAIHDRYLAYPTPTLRIVPYGTGPPGLHACPHAPVLQSTRLLI